MDGEHRVNLPRGRAGNLVCVGQVGGACGQNPRGAWDPPLWLLPLIVSASPNSEYHHPWEENRAESSTTPSGSRSRRVWNTTEEVYFWRAWQSSRQGLQEKRVGGRENHNFGIVWRRAIRVRGRRERQEVPRRRRP